MTRRRIVFTDQSGKRYVTPEFNGDKEEFEQFGMGDKCTADWDEIMAMFSDISTLEEFKTVSDKAQSFYISAIDPAAPPEPVIEINTENLLPDYFKSCNLIFLPEVNT